MKGKVGAEKPSSAEEQEQEMGEELFCGIKLGLMLAEIFWKNFRRPYMTYTKAGGAHFANRIGMAEEDRI